MFLLGVLTLVALIVWGIPFLGSLRKESAEREELAKATRPRFHCESCRYDFLGRTDEVAPLACPQCKKETAYRADFAQCLNCQTIFPSMLRRWSPADKTKWEAKLKGGELSRDEKIEMNQSEQIKLGDRNWMPRADFYKTPNPFRCPKCGNSDPAKIQTNAQPVLTESK